MNNTNMNKLLALFTVLATFLWTSYGKTIYVNANFPTAGNGTDWSSPYTNLQDAVTASVAGDLVLVTNGVYSPITISKAITVQSVNGYADTIIDGGGVARCATLGTGVVLRGFLLKNGYISGSGGGVSYGSVYDSMISNNLATVNGGGAYGSALVSNCVVVGNIASYTNPNATGGGGTYNCTTVMDSLISGNIATNGTYTKGGGSYGGTLYRCRVENNLGKEGGGVSNSHVYDSVICGNESFVNNGSGGGYWAANTTYNVSNCVISSNSAPAGGGVWGATLRNCVVSNNVATVTVGGGVRGTVVYDSLIVNNSAKINGGGANSGTLTGCTISGNSAKINGGGTYGGTLTGCTISGNTAFNDGGGTYSSTAYDSLIVSNVATRAGGALMRGQYYNCTIYGNTAPDYAVGHANGHTTEPALYNCVVYGNVNTGANARHLQIVSSGVFAFSSIDGANRFSTALTPEQFVQSIYADPLFTDPLLNDFSLRPESPCINKGANQHVTTATDLTGRPRIKDWRVDMGAYENQSQRLAVTPNPLYPMGRTQIDVTLDDYVQDGLIQHFDGHVLDPAVKVWPQLVEGQPNHFVPYYDDASMYNAYTLVPGVGMVFDTNGTYRSRPRFYTDSFAFFGSNGPPGTVEMCVTQTSNPPNTNPAMSGNSGGPGLTMMNMASTNPSWGIYARVNPWFGGQPTYSHPTAYETNMLITTSAIIDKGLLASVFVNGVEKTVGNYGSVIPGRQSNWPMYIGGDNFTGRGFVGTVHAIRIYDRKLEPWEVEKNRKLDERRF